MLDIRDEGNSMKNVFTNNKLLMLLSAVVFVGGYFFLRLAYKLSDSMPFTQEIILIALGTIATILITAMLLNKQTSVELEKEQSVKFIDLKTDTYQNLIDILEEIMLLESISNKELTKLRFNTHRLSIFASPEVLKEYRNFLNVFNEYVASDKEVNGDDEDRVSEALAKLTVYIRADIIGELDAQSAQSAKQIREQIMSNSK